MIEQARLLTAVAEARRELGEDPRCALRSRPVQHLQGDNYQETSSCCNTIGCGAHRHRGIMSDRASPLHTPRRTAAHQICLPLSLLPKLLHTVYEMFTIQRVDDELGLQLISAIFPFEASSAPNGDHSETQVRNMTLWVDQVIDCWLGNEWSHIGYGAILPTPAEGTPERRLLLDIRKRGRDFRHSRCAGGPQMYTRSPWRNEQEEKDWVSNLMGRKAYKKYHFGTVSHRRAPSLHDNGSKNPTPPVQLMIGFGGQCFRR